MLNLLQVQSGKTPSALWSWLVLFLLPLAVLVSVWVPEFAHYYVRPAPVSAQTVELARTAPTQAILDEIGAYRVLHPWRDAVPATQVIAEADRILQGRYVPNDYTDVNFSWPFDPADIDAGPLSWRLYFAAFIVPDRLLKAYALTGKEIYFEKAVEFFKAWHAHEESLWRPKSLLWNDHALAERIYVLVDFWRIYRQHSGFDADTAAQMLRMMQRCADLLAKPSYFTFATNHGVMENLALMHLGVAIPQLPRSAEYLALGRTRIQKQFDFFVSPEGPVLEHSAFYHRFGLGLIGMYTRYMALSHEALPPGWAQKYNRAVDFLATLRRPDGTLPMLGDSTSEADPIGPPVFAGTPADFTKPLTTRMDWKPNQPLAFYPLSGYSIWWNGLSDWPDEQKLSQLMVTWSHFPGHGHQRAQDLSVLFWAAGQTWWTNTGYWSYSHPARLEVESWAGGGGPHAQGEPARGQRTTAVLGYAQARELRALDLERKTEDGLRIRRQVIQASPELWIVLDQTEDRTGRPVIATWTTYPDVTVERGDRPDSYLFKAEGKPATLDVSVIGAEGVSVHQRRGDMQPLAGWAFVDGRAAEANALLVTHNKNLDWSAVIWSLGSDGKPTIVTAPRISWKDAQNWNATVGLASGQVEISRLGNVVQVGNERLNMQAPPDTSQDRLAMRQAYTALEQEYPKFADVPTYRAKMTYILLAVLAMQAGIYFFMRRYRRQYVSALLGALGLAWVMGAVWLHAVYFTI